MTGRVLQGPRLKIRVPKKSLGQLFFNSCLKYADHICQVDGTTDRTETYKSVKLRSVRVSMDLERREVSSKDVIAFCGGSTLDTVIPILATFYLGAKVANLEPSLSVQQTQHLLSLVSPKIIFVDEDSLTLIEDSLKEANLKSEIIVYGKSTKYATLSDLTKPKKNESTFRPSGVDLNEVALIFFSSGTTGPPKAICHTHNTFMHIGCSLKEFNMGEALLHFTSFYWITANFMLIVSMMTGGRRVFLSSVDPEATYRSIEKYKVSTAFLSPVLVDKLTSFELAKSYDNSSLRIILTSGTALTAVQHEKLSHIFDHSMIIFAYGMTEAGLCTSFHPDFDQDLITEKPLSCGIPFYDVKLKIVDVETEKLLNFNEKGEIRIWSPSLFYKYYKDDTSGIYDKDGFLKTGDIGYYDEDGCVYMIERLKEMFKYRTCHVVPSAIEAVLLEYPAVQEAVVFGVPSGDDGEVPGACVVLQEGSSATEKDIEEFVARNVSDAEKLRGGVTFVSNLLRTPTGKYMRREIRESVIKNVSLLTE